MEGLVPMAVVAGLACAALAAMAGLHQRLRPAQGLRESAAAGACALLACMAFAGEFLAVAFALAASAVVLVVLSAWRDPRRHGSGVSLIASGAVLLLLAGTAQWLGLFPAAVLLTACWLALPVTSRRIEGAVRWLFLVSGVAGAAATLMLASGRGGVWAAAWSAGLVAAVAARPVGLSIDLARRLSTTEEAERRGRRRAEITDRFSRTIAGNLDPDEVLEKALDALVEWSGAELAGITMVREGTETVELAAGRNVPEAVREALGRRPLRSDEGLIGEVFRTGRSLLIDPSSDDRLTRSFALADGWRSVLLAPLPARGRVHGALGLVCRVPGAFTGEHVRTLNDLAEILGLAVDTARTYRTLDRDRRFARRMIDRAGVLVVAMDPALRVTVFNRTAETTLGWRARDAVGRLAPELLATESQRETCRLQAQALFANEPVPEEAEMRCPTRDGQTLNILWRHAVISGDRDRPAELICFGVDVTEMRRGQDALVAMHEEALTARRRAEKALSSLHETQARLHRSEKLSAVGEMLAGVVHELNHPMTGILGFSEMARSAEIEPGKRDEYLARVEEEAMRARKILRGLLSFSRRDEIARYPLELNPVVRDVMALQRFGLRSDGIVVEMDLDPDLGRISGDPGRLEQVLVNLLVNARQAVESRDGTRCIRVVTRRVGSTVRLEVEDNGPGVTAEIGDRVFEPFFTTKPRGRGSGLGLTVSFGIVRDHGGEVRHEPRPGGGSRFVVELPALEERASDPAADRPVAEVPLGTGFVNEGPVPLAGSLRVLAVDDEESVLDVVRESLTRLGYEVDTACSGLDALHRLGEGSYDLVLSDLRMPGMSGPELYSAISERWPALARHTLFLTGDTVSERASAFLERTGVPYLEKPFEIRELVEAVRLAADGVAPDDDHPGEPS